DPGRGTLILAGGQLITLDERGNLLIAPASPNGFEPVAEAQVLRGTCWTVPTLANGLLYLRSKSELVCLDMRPAGTADKEDDTAPADDPGIVANQPDDVAPSDPPGSSSTKMDAPRESPSKVGKSTTTKPSAAAGKKPQAPVKTRKRISKEFLTLSLCMISGLITVILYLWWKHAGMYMFGKS
ncbi:MAG: hypothetical protein QF886_24445, partial [Planctomycetota bacterium]|nr:hypothetical protein [Planctomycetota bacterium]